MKLFSFFILVLIEWTSAVIYRLNETEYYRMPPVTHLDPYERCLSRPGGVYCSAELGVVADGPNELYSLMKEYSEHTVTHFNRTQLFYGVCMTSTCRDFYNANETDLKHILEACLNKTLWDEYQLKTRVTELISCDKHGDTKQVYAADIVVAVILMLIVMLNLIGSLYGFYCISRNKQDRNWLLCFSIVHNWEKLVKPPNPDPEVARFRGLSGMRSLTMMLVILGHAFLPSALSAVNEFEFEQLYDNLAYQIFFNGTLIVQTFFVISGFLLMMKILTYSEHHQMSWRMVPKGIISRWLRLTPSYAVLLAFTATWMRFTGAGPFWARIAEIEVNDCRRHWFYNLLYLNNYIDKSHCMTHTWYLACDMQLHVLGLIILGVFTSGRARKIALGCLFTVGMLTPMLHTYFQNLDAVLLVSPTIMTTFFVTDPTFNNVYKRSHTNIVNFALGLIAGWIVHGWKKKQIDEANFKKYRYGMWLVWPAMLGVVDLGALFYQARPPPARPLRALYSSLVKASFGMCAVLVIMGCVLRVEDLYRGILEWRGWTALARLSYCAYLIHVMLIRILGGMRSTLTHVSFLQINMEVYGMIALALLVAVPFWLMVESPLSQLVNILLAGNEKEKPTKTEVNMNEKTEKK
ncbi:nose resistant to fluoxetine protein 6-like [Plodia interpunctella]|uniref:nose resistant to fluoxetine protein 6-like n=1 Tax=Plodia interpunctella TaxID=58824 RepID=UPI002367F66E|nr:nose resistant to fluoxetine protein 6-like [Plodia interpunctella]